MIYAGTIILNLLAASIDDRSASRRYQLQNNTTTVTAIMESLDGSNQVNLNLTQKINLKIILIFF